MSNNTIRWAAIFKGMERLSDLLRKTDQWGDLSAMTRASAARATRRLDGEEAAAGFSWDRQAKPRGAWTAEEVARHERATQAQVAHDRERGVSVNLEEAAKLGRFANRFSEAFRHARRGA